MVGLLQPITNQNSVNVLFLLDQKTEKFESGIALKTACYSKTIMDCVKSFVTEKPMKSHSGSNEWMSFEIKNEFMNEIHCSKSDVIRRCKTF